MNAPEIFGLIAGGGLIMHILLAAMLRVQDRLLDRIVGENIESDGARGHE